jgi:hypothetical protein
MHIYRAFQEWNHLPVTGELDEETLKLINVLIKLDIHAIIYCIAELQKDYSSLLCSQRSIKHQE